MKAIFKSAALCALVFAASVQPVHAQAEVMAWGNLEGMRLEGQLIPFETSLCALAPDGGEVARTAKERQRPRFSRAGNRRTVTTSLRSFSITKVTEDTGPGTATVAVTVSADSAASAGGSFCVDLPRPASRAAEVELIGRTRTAGVTQARGFRVTRPHRLEVRFAEPAPVSVSTVKRQGTEWTRVAVGILPPGAQAGATARNTFAIAASGPIDRSPVQITLDASRPGRSFAGLGGNFRIQNPTLDPKVIQYNLENLRLAWGRVEMPWRLWHPEQSVEPWKLPPEQLNPRVRAAMEMARDLARRNIPVIVSVWFPPDWAAIGEVRSEHPGGVRGNQLNPAQMERTYESIYQYLAYLKKHYGVETAMFSFNESDLGIDVRQTAEEHRDFIKGFGAYVAARGLMTRMLLGDTSDANPTDFIRPAMQDPAAWPFIGGVSFHSWRGWSDELLRFWGDAAKKLNVPLLVGEGSTDAGAWRYPAVFQEPSFALEEINLYTRMLALSEPLSILQWQLTSDYSILAGGGLFGDSTALRPTQRFWNLKQLASTPEGSFALPVSCATPTITCAGFGDIARGIYALHIVNNGASRPATLSGIPNTVRELRVWVTDPQRGMEQVARVPVSGGRAQFTLPATSFVTLSNSQPASLTSR